MDELHTMHHVVFKNYMGFVLDTAIEKTSSKSAPRRWQHVRRCPPSVFKPRACMVPAGARTAPKKLSAGRQPDLRDTVPMHCILLAVRGPPWISEHQLMFHMLLGSRDHQHPAERRRASINIFSESSVPPCPHECVDDHVNHVVRALETHTSTTRSWKKTPPTSSRRQAGWHPHLSVGEARPKCV